MSNRLLDSPAKILQALLIQLNLGTLAEDQGEWPVYSIKEPTGPDSCITCYDTAGLMQGRLQIGGEHQEQMGVQIRVRSAIHDDGWGKSDEILHTLDSEDTCYQVVVSVEDREYLVHSFNRTSPILPIGTEAGSNRKIFTLNGTLTVSSLD